MKQTPMGRVWFIVLFSMCFVFGASWIWHTSGISEQTRRNNAEDDVVTANTRAIASYRDVLKEKGEAEAEAYLMASSSASRR